ncbi:MAG TPA: hypothetical protein VEJ18_09345 [Planctomycetota bacterium]|nr:hypothetical protein [Planctomycetota bacterium]
MSLLLATLLALQAKAGDRMTVGVESVLDLEITVRDGVGENRRLLSLVRKEKFSQEATEVAEGRPTAARIQVVASTLQRSGTDVPIEEQPTPLAGKTFVSRRAADGWVAQDPQGGAAPIEGASLGGWNELWRLLPASEPKAGTSWTVDGREIIPLLHPMGLAEASGKLECTAKSVEGGRVTVQFKGGVQGRPRDEAATRLSFSISEGTLVYDLGKGRPVSLTLSGAVEAALDQVDVFRKPVSKTESEEERRKIGEILVRSTQLRASFTFE